MSIAVMRRVSFNAGHRLLGHEGKCRYFHGHNYAAEFHVQPDDGETLDSVGRVVDFAEIKLRLKRWIDDNWDHGFILWSEDANGIQAIESVDPPRLFLLPANPTAEAMARYLLENVCPDQLADLPVVCTKVVLWESADTCAIATSAAD